jgi:hypothetical protein
MTVFGEVAQIRVGKAQRAHQLRKRKNWWARRKCAFAHPTASIVLYGQPDFF